LFGVVLAVKAQAACAVRWRAALTAAGDRPGRVKKSRKGADIHRCEGDLAKQTAIERKRALALWMWEQLTR